jgi:hypothetical protein
MTALSFDSCTGGSEQNIMSGMTLLHDVFLRYPVLPCAVQAMSSDAGSSQSPADIGEFGGTLFGDRRFCHVFVFHNGAQSSYDARAIPWIAHGLRPAPP